MTAVEAVDLTAAIVAVSTIVHATQIAADGATPGGRRSATIAVLAGALVVVAPAMSAVWAIGATVLAALAWSWVQPTHRARTGADQLRFLVALGVAASALPIHDIERVVVVFIAAQLGLAYAVSGAAKALTPAWRSGAALAGVLRTKTFGGPLASFARGRTDDWFRLPALVLVAAELSAPLVWFAPDSVVPVAIGIAVVFHVATGFVLGLDDFTPAFATALPAAAFCLTTW